MFMLILFSLLGGLRQLTSWRETAAQITPSTQRLTADNRCFIISLACMHREFEYQCSGATVKS